MKLRSAVQKSLLACLLAAAACGPSLQQIRRYVEVSPRRRVAVLPFGVAPGRPKSGLEAAAIMSAQLKDLGFLLSEPAKVEEALSALKLKPGSAPAPEDAQRAGRLLGAAAVLTGAVTAVSEEKSARPAVYQDQTTTTKDARGNPQQVTGKVLLTAATTVTVRSYSAAARLTDVETGQPLWESSGTDQREDESILQVSQDLLANLARELGSRFLKKSL